MRVGSLFSGIGGFDLGLERAGHTVAWQVENDAACNKVLARHWPAVPRHLDVREVSGERLGPVDLVCGGFPCQDLSVAGRRAGLAGERSGLWFEFHRILAELAPRWCLIENVPGLLSSDGGRDFAILLRGLGELGYGVSWRVLDAQYDALAQRRERVFIVGSLGDFASAEVLLEPESVRWHSPPRREAGEEVAAPVGGGASGAGRMSEEAGEQLVTVPAMTGSGRGTARVGESRGQDPLVIVPELARPLGAPERGYRPDLESGAFVFESRFARNDRGAPSELVPPLKAQSGRSGKGDGAPLVATTLRSRQSSPGVSIPGRGGEDDANLVVIPDPAYALGAGHGGSKHGSGRERQDTFVVAGAVTGAETHNGNSNPIAANTPVLNGRVRRLTPLEAERLQGFPDGWTDGLSDSARYRVLGNAVAVPVAAWIGSRLRPKANGHGP